MSGDDIKLVFSNVELVHKVLRI